MKTLVSFLLYLIATSAWAQCSPIVVDTHRDGITLGPAGRGVSFGPRAWPATFSALVAEIDVNRETGKITVKHLYAAQDSGLGVNPASLENQIIGLNIFRYNRASR